jgi:hypothetical protein
MRWFARVVTACLSLSAFAGTTSDDDRSLKEDFRQLGHTFRDAAKDVARSTVRVSHRVLKKADERLNGSGAKSSKDSTK